MRRKTEWAAGIAGLKTVMVIRKKDVRVNKGRESVSLSRSTSQRVSASGWLGAANWEGN